MSATKCSYTTPSGKPCTWLAKYNGLCLAHAAKAGNPEAAEELRRRGRAGFELKQRRATARQRTTCSLRSTDNLLTELEQELVQAKRSGADPLGRAKCIVAIIVAARDTLKVAELETENRQLRDLIAERLPELRRHLLKPV